MSGHFDDLHLEPVSGPVMVKSDDREEWRVTCLEHDLDRTVDTEKHAINLMQLHARKDHQQPLTEVNLTQAARWVLGLREDDNLRTTSYSAALGTWCELLSLSTDAEALAVAETMAATDPPVTATVAPF